MELDTIFNIFSEGLAFRSQRCKLILNHAARCSEHDTPLNALTAITALIITHGSTPKSTRHDGCEML